MGTSLSISSRKQHFLYPFCIWLVVGKENQTLQKCTARLDFSVGHQDKLIS